MLYYNFTADDAFFLSGPSPRHVECGRSPICGTRIVLDLTGPVQVNSIQLGSTVLGSLAGITTLHQKRVEQEVADSLFEGLQRYFQKNPPVNSYMAWLQDQKKAQV